ncbi:response regulator [Pirellulaceae bacterium SH467]|jgi:CheY-like chemotaxis protein
MTTVMVIDDRRDSERIVSRKLIDMGFEVFSRDNAEGLVETLDTQPVDLIILDMNMPEVDGCEATILLRSHPVYKDLPIVLCTAHPLPGDQERAMSAGCNRFLEKPLQSEELRTILSELLTPSPTSVTSPEQSS